MIFGAIVITETAVETHRDSYLLDHLSVISARRPFFAAGVICAAGLIGFCLAFSDLLYAHEIVILGGMAVLCLVLGRSLGQLQLLSRDLKGTELSSVIFGTYRHLTRVRRDIVSAVQARAREDKP